MIILKIKFPKIKNKGLGIDEIELYKISGDKIEIGIKYNERGMENEQDDKNKNKNEGEGNL
jgi:hypothetical protein